ncbi:FG-GAP-like repeat-containing protein [Pseudarthrobacter sp. B907]|uniref:FG-GAP-like repeat-containing protein n=1 Tax=Pseudarthrobacter sp. B907 TaxID=3158261 RepID=UPI0032D9C666
MALPLVSVSAFSPGPASAAPPTCQPGAPAPVDPYPGTTAAATNFESGNLTPFTVFTAGTGSVSVSSTSSHSPSCAAFLHATTDGGSIAKMSVGLTPTMKEVYADGWFNIAKEGVSGNDVPYFRFFSGGIRYLDVFRHNISSDLVLRITGATGFTYITVVPTVALNSWHHLVVHVVPNGAATGVQIWWDEKSVYANSGVNISAQRVDTVQLGAEHDQQMGDIYADDVIINSGAETPAPVPGPLPGPTPTPTPSPAPNPTPPPGTGPGDWTEKLVAGGDVNGDGIPDLVQRQADGTLWFFAGDGTGKFVGGQRIGDFGWQIYDQIVGVGDYNGDGRPDLVCRNLDGSLWLYAGTGRVDATSKGFAGGVKIGNFGWNMFDTLLGVGDFDGNGLSDLVARKPDGTLWLYSGAGNGLPGTARQIDFGWSIFDKLVAIRDFNGDGTSDLVGRKPDGTLWFYANTGAARLVNGQQIGTGWNIYGDIIGVGDANKDGRPDMVARQSDGSGFFYAGTGTAGGGYLAPPARIGAFGWQAFNMLVNVHDFNGDAKDDLLARKPDGTLWFYPGTGAGGYGPAVKIGNFGWDGFDALVGAGDVDGDGKNDLIARSPDGSLWLYPGTGAVNATSTGYGLPVKIGNFGWNSFNALVGVGDVNGDGKNDLAARKPDGSLWLYPGTGAVNATSTGYGLPVKIGNFGWNSFNALVGVGDVNGDGKNDLAARKPDGSLWLYPGTGAVNATSTGYGLPVKIGAFGWDTFDIMTGVGDFNGDGHNDLVARKPDGTLWYYQGTGRVDATSGGYKAAVKIGYFGWNSFDSLLGSGDLNGDGHPDLVARKPDGTLWTYPGTGLPSEGYLGRTPAGTF